VPWAELLIEGRSMREVAAARGDPVDYQPRHVYRTTIRGTGRPLELHTDDARMGSWRDNRGKLTVRIFER
jgi:hypothetical protein